MSKKWAPRKRSKSSITWAAVNGDRAIRISPDTISIIQTNSGSRPRVMPGQRMDSVVVIMLMAPAMLPKPLIRMPSTQ